MFKFRSQLLAVASLILGTSSAGGNTHQRIGNFFVDIIEATARKCASRTVYVDPVSGSDAAPSSGTHGDIDHPFATIAAAKEDIGTLIFGYVLVMLAPHPDAEGYDEDEFWDGHVITSSGVLEYRGREDVEVLPPMAIVSLDGHRMTFSGVSWEPEEHIGLTLEVVTSATPGLAGRRSTIANNTASTLWGIWVDSYPDGAYPQVGDTVRVVRPAVAISSAPRASDGASRCLIGGRATVINVNQSRPRTGMLRLRNLEIRSPDNATHSEGMWYATGAFDFTDCHFTSDSDIYGFIIFKLSTILAGQWIDDSFDPGEYVYGLGLSLRSRSPTTRYAPNMWAGQTTMEGYITTDNQLNLAESSWCSWLGGGMGRIAIENAYCILASTGSEKIGPHVFSAEWGNSCLDVVGAGSVDIRGCTILGNRALVNVNSDWSTADVGSGGSAHVRTQPVWFSGSAPEHTTGAESKARRGGRIEIHGAYDIGDVSVGRGTHRKTRPAGAWAANEMIIEDTGFGSVIGRQG